MEFGLLLIIGGIFFSIIGIIDFFRYKKSAEGYMRYTPRFFRNSYLYTIKNAEFITKILGITFFIAGVLFILIGLISFLI